MDASAGYRRLKAVVRRRRVPKPPPARAPVERGGATLISLPSGRHARERAAEAALDLAPLRQVAGAEDRDRAAGAAHAAGAADAVREQFVRLRQLEVDDARDVQHVEAARGDVRRQQDRRLAGAELLEHAVALRPG